MKNSIWSLTRIEQMLKLNIRLWRSTFWRTWEPLPFDQKLAWIAFISQTLAVITLIEMFLLGQ